MENNIVITPTLQQDQLYLNKKQIAMLAKIRAEEMLGREIPPDKAYIMLYKLEHFCSTMMTYIKPKALDTFSGDQKKTIFNQEVSTYAPGKFSYSHNPEWQELADQLADIKKKMDTLQDRMKAAWKQIGVDMVDTETGEVIPPAKYHTGKPTFRVL